MFEVNAATKRPLQNNKRGTSAEQAGRGAHMVHQIKAPGAMIRPGAAREFQFPEYTDSPEDVNLASRLMMRSRWPNT
jgi:hypothetical protein